MERGRNQPDSAGDDRAFSERLTAYRDVVTRVAYRLTGGDWSAAEDVAQETFLRVWNAADRYEERGNLRAYLLTVAHRVAADRRRAERPTADLADRDHRPDFSTDAARRAEENAVGEAAREAVSALPGEQRAVFVLSHYEGMTYREIAEILGCPVGTVASRKYQAVLTLRERLAPYVTVPEGDEP